MSKKTTSLSIDSNVIEEAKSKFVNMSAVAEKAIKEKIGKRDVEIDESIKQCFYCGKECEKASVDNQGKYHNGMIWLWPDEKWICIRCLKIKSERVTKWNH